MKKIVCILTVLQFVIAFSWGATDSLIKSSPQKASFKIEINSNVAHPGDTIDLNATYAVGDKKLPRATLDIILENERGNTWSVRWPMTNGKSSGSIVFPKDLPPGIYHAWCGVKPRPFKIYGQVVYCSSKINKLQVEVATLSGLLRYSQTISIPKDGSFVIENWQLIDVAAVMFSTGRRDILDIQPEMVMDSAYYPASKAYAQILVTEKDTVFAVPGRAPASQPLSWNGPAAFRDLEPANLYNMFYSNGRFRDTAEILISLVGNDEELKGKTAGTFLKSELKRLLPNSKIEGSKININSLPATIYLDELPADYAAIAKLEASEFSIIKLIPAVEKNGGALVAFYSKRFPFTSPHEAQNRFVLKGYSNEIATLTY